MSRRERRRAWRRIGGLNSCKTGWHGELAVGSIGSRGGFGRVIRIRQIPCNFHNQHLSCANQSLRSRLTLREEGQVAGLESPNGLGATTYFQVGKIWSTQISKNFSGSSEERRSSLGEHVYRLGASSQSFHSPSVPRNPSSQADCQPRRAAVWRHLRFSYRVRARNFGARRRCATPADRVRSAFPRRPHSLRTWRRRVPREC